MNPEQITIASLLVAALIAGARGWWVFGYLYQAALRERDFWRDRALAGTGLAEIAADVAEKQAPGGGDAS